MPLFAGSEPSPPALRPLCLLGPECYAPRVVLSSSRLKRILSLSLPIMGAMVSQNLMNLADTAMVARVGQSALAAVGLAGFAAFFAQAFLMGLSVGVQSMAARRKGQGQLSVTALPLNAGLLLAAALAVPIAAIAALLAPSFFTLLSADPEVVAAGVPYFRVRMIGTIAVAINFAFRGYWNGVGLSHIYLRVLVFMQVVNLSLSYVLIFGKFGVSPLGATGAAIGTAVATFCGVASHFTTALFRARSAGFLRALPAAETLRAVLRLGIPSGLQQLFFSGGMLALFWIVGRVGTTELAAANLLVNVVMVGILPGMGLGLAALSLVGEALGQRLPREARRWGWEVCRVGMLLIALVGLPLVVAPQPILDLFSGGDALLVATASAPLRVSGYALVFDVVGMVLMNALMGAGDTRRVALISIGLQWLVFLPLMYAVGSLWGGGLLEIWLVQSLARVVQAGVFAAIWRGSSWQGIRV